MCWNGNKLEMLDLILIAPFTNLKIHTYLVTFIHKLFFTVKIKKIKNNLW